MVADGVSIVCLEETRKDRTLPGTRASGNIGAAQWDPLRRPLGAAAQFVKADAPRRSGDGSAAELHSRRSANLHSRGRPSFRAARKARKRDGGSRPQG